MGPENGVIQLVNNPRHGGTISIQRSELGQVIDGIQRAIGAVEHCQNFVQNADRHFKAEVNSLEASKKALERFMRL